MLDQQLSQNTVWRRIDKSSQNVITFSSQVDEYTDVSDTAQLLVFKIMLMDDFTLKEKWL